MASLSSASRAMTPVTLEILSEKSSTSCVAATMSWFDSQMVDCCSDSSAPPSASSAPSSANSSTACWKRM